MEVMQSESNALKNKFRYCNKDYDKNPLPCFPPRFLTPKCLNNCTGKY